MDTQSTVHRYDSDNINSTRQLEMLELLPSPGAFRELLQDCFYSNELRGSTVTVTHLQMTSVE